MFKQAGLVSEEGEDFLWLKLEQGLSAQIDGLTIPRNPSISSV